MGYQPFIGWMRLGLKIMGPVPINSVVEYQLWGEELISPDIAGMFRWILGVRDNGDVSSNL